MIDVVEKYGGNEPYKYYVGPEGDSQVKLPVYKNCLPESDPATSLQERDQLLKRIYQANPNYAKFKNWPEPEVLFKTLGINEIRRVTVQDKYCIDGIILPSTKPDPKETDLDIYCGYMPHNVLIGVALNVPSYNIVGSFPEFSVYRYALPDGKCFSVANLRQYQQKYTPAMTNAVLQKTKASFYMVDFSNACPNPRMSY
jgi:hypothetical protein